MFFFGLQPRFFASALRSAVDVVSAGFGSTSAASARVDGFGASSVVAPATAGAWAAAEDAAAPASSANALSATRIGAMRGDDQQVPLVPADGARRAADDAREVVRGAHGADAAGERAAAAVVRREQAHQFGGLARADRRNRRAVPQRARPARRPQHARWRECGRAERAHDDQHAPHDVDGTRICCRTCSSIGHAKLGLKTQAPAGRAGSGLAVAEGVIGHDEHDAAVAAVAAVDLSLQLVVVVSAEGPLTTTTFFFFSALLIFAAADVAFSSSSPASSSSSAFVGGGKSLMQFTMRRQNAGPAALVLGAIF